MSIGTLHLVENALLASSEGATYSTRPPGYPAGASEPSTRAESPEGDEAASGAAGSEAEGAARGPPLRSPRDHGPPGLYAEAPLRGAKANGRPKIDEEKVRERVVVLLESEELMEAVCVTTTNVETAWRNIPFHASPSHQPEPRGSAGTGRQRNLERSGPAKQTQGVEAATCAPSAVAY